MSEKVYFPALAKATAIRIVAGVMFAAVAFAYGVFCPLQSQLNSQSATLSALHQECEQKKNTVESLKQQLAPRDSTAVKPAPLRLTNAKTIGLGGNDDHQPVQQPGSVLRLLSQHNINVDSLERSDASSEIVVRFCCSYEQAQAAFGELAASSAFVQVASLSCQADQLGGGAWQLSLVPVERVQ